MIKFWPEQEEILNYKEGIMAVPSVPGSGKTFTLTHEPPHATIAKKSKKKKRFLLVMINIV